MSKRGFGHGLWCLARDFTAILNQSERKGSSVQSSRIELEKFQSFVANMELQDVPLLGRKFT